MKLTYKGNLQPYKRPLYYKDTKVRRGNSVMQDNEIADYRKRILNSFQLCTYRTNTVALYPLNKPMEIGMKALIYTPVRCSLLANIKNILDALNERAFQDDRLVRKIYAKQKYSTKARIEITLYTYNATTAKYTNTIKFTAHDIIPIKKILPNKRNVLYTKEYNWENTRNKKSIQIQLSVQFANKQPQRNIRMAIHMFVSSAKRNCADIDNIALMLLSGMKGLVFNSLKDITALTLKLEQTHQNDYAEISMRHIKLQRH